MSVCGKCGKENATYLCGSCKTSRYCSESCQNAAWKFHKKVCKQIAKGKKPKGEDHIPVPEYDKVKQPQRSTSTENEQKQRNTRNRRRMNPQFVPYPFNPLEFALLEHRLPAEYEVYEELWKSRPSTMFSAVSYSASSLTGLRGVTAQTQIKAGTTLNPLFEMSAKDYFALESAKDAAMPDWGSFFAPITTEAERDRIWLDYERKSEATASFVRLPQSNGPVDFHLGFLVDVFCGDEVFATLGLKWLCNQLFNYELAILDAKMAVKLNKAVPQVTATQVDREEVWRFRFLPQVAFLVDQHSYTVVAIKYQDRIVKVYDDNAVQTGIRVSSDELLRWMVILSDRLLAPIVEGTRMIVRRNERKQIKQFYNAKVKELEGRNGFGYVIPAKIQEDK